MATSFISSIKMACISYIKMSHKLAEIAKRGFLKDIKIIAHQNVAKYFDIIDFY